MINTTIQINVSLSMEEALEELPFGDYPDLKEFIRCLFMLPNEHRECLRVLRKLRRLFDKIADSDVTEEFEEWDVGDFEPIHSKLVVMNRAIETLSTTDKIKVSILLESTDWLLPDGGNPWAVIDHWIKELVKA